MQAISFESDETYVFEDHPFALGAKVATRGIDSLATVDLCRLCDHTATFPWHDCCLRCDARLRRRGARRTKVKRGRPWCWR